MELFIWIVAAGSAGGVLRVVQRSLAREHRANSRIGLVLTGLLHPFVGALLAVVIVVAFNSGFISMPIENADSGATVGTWTRGNTFLVFAAFVGGFAENFVTGVISRLRA